MFLRETSACDPGRTGTQRVVVMNKAFSFRDHDKRRFHLGSTIDRARNAVGRSVKALAERIAGDRRLSRLYKELAAMSDTQRADVGISRADIRAAVTGTYGKRQPSVSDTTLSSRRKRSPSPGRSDQPSDQGALI